MTLENFKLPGSASVTTFGQNNDLDTQVQLKLTRQVLLTSFGLHLITKWEVGWEFLKITKIRGGGGPEVEILANSCSLKK